MLSEIIKMLENAEKCLVSVYNVNFLPSKLHII